MERPDIIRNIRQYREVIDIVLLADPIWKRGWFKFDRRHLEPLISPSLTLMPDNEESPDVVVFDAIVACEQKLGIAKSGRSHFEVGAAAVLVSRAFFKRMLEATSLDRADEAGNTALHYMAQRLGAWALWDQGAKRWSQECCWRLHQIISTDVDIGHRNNGGDTALNALAHTPFGLQSVVLDVLIFHGGADPFVSDGFGRLPIYCVAKSGNWPAVIHLLFLCEQSRQASHAVEEARKGLSHRECASDETRFLETFLDHLDIISKYPESTQKYVDLEPGWRAEYRCQVQDPISCMSGKGFASAEDKIILKGFCTSMFTRCQRLRLHQQILANVVAQPSLRTLRSSTRNWECSPPDD